MPEHCTCGAKLVEDARFCHRCGRPTREEERIEEVVEARPVVSAPTPAERLAQLPVNFGNPIALRVAFLLSMVIILIQNIPIIQLLAVIWWMAAGWVAVLWYRRITGSLLSVKSGARLGSITGVMIFISLTVQASIQMLVAGKEIFEQLVAKDPNMSEMMKSPVLLGFAFLITLVVVFAVVVGICAAGGALGARFNLRRSNA